ncbi:malate:quinone oxidoreductase [Leucobacter sp. CSA1]|uniref:Probable malate:quinone oxidoreductase n=1 Tax=Leucobacter chromiisoli TaxID=2796471 RepID=A0A934Q863_9MICO|nr:malate:quinone oxidoreductase [Leucobacter chromiisoli]MBK0419591.1 malate:quinone oxidoreductase [Leucobacter chromiisoli]
MSLRAGGPPRFAAGVDSETVSNNTVDVVLIGGGVMSATLGTLIKQVQPDWSIEIFESRSAVATESSNAWNNAGTGHAALCELNYMPEGADGSLSADKAISINEQFQLSRQWWSSLVKQGVLGEPSGFINATPHMTFVRGEANVDYLRRRYEILKQQPLFSDMEFSDDPAQIAEWTPLLVDRRSKDEVFAATRSLSGTDVDFGAITRRLIGHLVENGARLRLGTQVKKLRRREDGTWDVYARNRSGYGTGMVNARFVFVGAGGGALSLLQSSGIPEIRGFGGFPISGKFLKCDNPEIVKLHRAKVYGKAAVGAPPMSVPHLDTRIVNGKESLLFGPYAGFSPNFLKKGSWWDLPGSIRPHNLGPMLKVGLTEFSLEKYLLGEVLASREKQMGALREYMPTARTADWKMITAGQRVQVMKKDPKKGGVLQFGTEVITGAEGSIAGLLGASPGASTAVHAMLGVLQRCFPEQFESRWKGEFAAQVPALGTAGVNHDPVAAAATLAETGEVLGLTSALKPVAVEA